MATLFTGTSRRGEFIHELNAVPDGQTQIEIAMPFDAARLRARVVSVDFRIEQSVDGVTWWPLGGGHSADLRAGVQRRVKPGRRNTPQRWSRFTEQIYRHDIFKEHNWAAAHELTNDADGAHYHQLAMCPRLRLITRVYHPTPDGDIADWADLWYQMDAEIRRTAAPATPIGRHSASLLGTFTAAEEGDTNALSGSRTSVSGSLIVGQGSTWNSTDTGALAITDSNSNAYQEHLQDTVSSGAGSFGEFVLSSNNNGTRGASHTLTCTSGTNGVTCGGLEFDGVSTSATVDVGSLSNATGTAASCSVTPSAGAALVVGIMAYDGAATTFAVNVGNLGLEVDENNDRQSNGTNYVVAATGATTVSWTIALSRAWAARAVAWTEIPPTGSIALTGTAAATINEADIVAGGKTIILTATDDTWAPAAVVTAITQPASANGGTASTTSFSITLPTTQADDILILEFCHRGTGDGTIGGTSVSVGGLTWNLKHSQLFATSTFSGKLYWTRATGNHSGQTVTGSSLTNACAAILKVKRGVVASGDPFTNAATIVGEENASGNETQAQITTLVDGAEVNLTILNSPDLAVATHSCTSPGALGSEVEVLSTGGTDASISSACAVKASAGGTGSFTWAQTDAAGGSYAYALQPVTTTPFADARAAIRDGLDSAQAEAAGWDAKVKPNIPVANIVRTSDTVCTITLHAQADYNITAQETITATVPATALVGGNELVATPTFTIDTGGGGGGPTVKTLATLGVG